MAPKQKSINVLRNNLHYMRIHNVWPKDGEELKPPRSFYAKYLLFIVPTIIPIMLHYIKIGHIISNTDTQSYLIALELTEATSLLGLWFNTLVFLPEIPKIAVIYHEFSDFAQNLKWRPGRSTLARFNFYGKCWYYYLSFAMSVVVIGKLFLEDCTKNIDLHIERRPCGLLYNIYIPFGSNNIIITCTICFIQICTLFINVRMGSTSSFGIGECAHHVIVRIQVFKYNLRKVLERKVIFCNINEWKEELRSVVEEHCRIIDLSHRLQKAYKNISCSHFIMTSAIIGLSLFAVIKTHSPAPLVHLIGWIVSLWTTCLSSERLITESLDISNIITNSRWYMMKTPIRKDLQMMLLVAQKPLYLESFSFSRFSLSFILMVLKTSYSYIALMQNL